MDYGKSILRAGFTGLFHEVYISYGTNPYLISYYPASLSFSNLLKKSAKSPPPDRPKTQFFFDFEHAQTILFS